MEAVTIAAFAEVSSAGSEKESEARKIDIVKPTPRLDIPLHKQVRPLEDYEVDRLRV